jgi:Ca2+-binding EF-hand superfamily protein
MKQPVLKEVTLAFSHLPGVCVQLSAKKFDEIFPDPVVDYHTYKNFVKFRLLEKGHPFFLLEEEIEKVCWQKCKAIYEDAKWRVPSMELYRLWQMFIRLAQEDTYPVVMYQTEVDWLLEKLATYIQKSWRSPDVGSGATFKDMMDILDAQVFAGANLTNIKKSIEELYNWLVLEICQVGWLYKRTRKQANWTNWVKRWFVLTPGKLSYYDGPSRKTLKGEVSITTHSNIEVLPDYKGFARTLKARFKITNTPYLEIEMCAPDQTERSFWIGAIKEVTEASNLGMTPVQALLQAKQKQRKESLEETERRIAKFQKTAKRILSAKEEEERKDNNEVIKPKQTHFLNQALKSTPPVMSNGSSLSDSTESEKEEEFDNNMYAYQKDKIKNVFLGIDKDGNGKIDLNEFTEFIKGLGLEMSEPEVKLLFITIDKDGNNFLCLGEFEEYFLRFIMDETGHGLLESRLRSAFLKADRDGTGTVDFREFTEFAWEKKRSIRVSRLLQYFGNMDKGQGEVSYQQFRSFFRRQHSMLDGVVEEDEEESPGNTLESKLKHLYEEADMEDLGDYLRKRWDVFASFKRYGASGDLVMKGGHGMVADVVPGEYSLVDLACFNDLPPITPKHVVIKGVKWESGTAAGKSGKVIFPTKFDGRIPIEIATQEHLSYYGASLADSNQVKVSLLYRHGIQDFSYQNQYLDDYVTNEKALAGAGIERHAFSHLDCPLDDDSGHFVMGKQEDDELHLTAFKVPTRHTLYVPGGVIHSNDYLKGTWRTMLSDEAEIDHVQLHRPKTGDESELEKFTFKFVERL